MRRLLLTGRGSTSHRRFLFEAVQRPRRLIHHQANGHFPVGENPGEGERLAAQLLQAPNGERGDPMIEKNSGRGHLVAGSFPPGSSAGHDRDYARLRLLGLLAERDVPVSVANDFANIEKWLPVTQLLITYVAGPYPIGWACMGPAPAAPSGSKACTSAAPSDQAPRPPRELLFDPSPDLQDSRRGERQ